MKRFLLSIVLLGFGILIFAQVSEYVTELNIQYYSDSVNQTDKYMSERCVLDLCYPRNINDFPTIVWFHGGGLTGGNKVIPEALKENGVIIKNDL